MNLEKNLKESVNQIVNDRTMHRGKLTSFVLLLLGILATSMPWLFLKGDFVDLLLLIGLMLIVASAINILSVRSLVGKPIRIRKN